MDELEARTPRYLRIGRAIRERIERGEYQPGTRLPPQRELSRQFGVTPMTLRQALQLLEQDGLLTSRPGSGTFVSHKLFSYDLGSLRSFAQEMRAQDIDMRTTVLSGRTVKGPAPATARLELLPGQTLFRLERLRSIGGQPVVYQRSFLPAELGRRLRPETLERRSLYDLLREELHVEVVRATERLVPVVLAAPEAVFLQEPSGAPAVISERTTFTIGDRPILFDQAFMPGDRLQITAERVSDTLSFRYEVLHG